MTRCDSKRSCSILVVDDDPGLANALRDFLQSEGYPVSTALSAEEALELIGKDRSICLALVDLVMPVTDGLTLMEQLHARDPDLPVIILTGYATIETAVEAIKQGAEDYVTKPIDREAVRNKVARLMELFELRARLARLEAGALKCCPPFESFVYVSASMEKVLEKAQAAAASDSPVLLVGETGTGKEMLARAIHGSSQRAHNAFVPVNCGALPRELVESELFGVRRGAFTGAYADAQGIFAAATGGTVFLDEIGEMPKEAQVKLLRVLQEGELRPVGSPNTRTVDVHILSATNRSLPTLRSDCLREDFYFRISTIVIEVPPLRSRVEDIAVLAQKIVSRIADSSGREIILGRSGFNLLLGYSFPGNVRELENILASVTALSPDDPQTITDKDLQPLLRSEGGRGLAARSGPVLSLEEVERMTIEHALRTCQGNRTRAAAQLGISRDTLHRKLREFKARGESSDSNVVNIFKP